MSEFKAARWAQFITLYLIISALAGCSPLYLLRASYEQSKILLSREPIETLVASPRTPTERREKLIVVLAAREFANQIGLQVGESFSLFAEIDRPQLSFILAACAPDQFAPYLWWFPIVGSVPYKGFFSRSEAESEGAKLQEQGYEISIRPTDAYSTLGWFNDPLLSTSLARSKLELAQTVFHESLHATVWIPGKVSFNESVAQFVGIRAALEFARKDPAGGVSAADAERSLRSAVELSLALTGLVEALRSIYAGPGSREEKVAARNLAYTEHLRQWRVLRPESKLLDPPNNAELLQLHIYYDRLHQIQAAYDRVGGEWPRFLDLLRRIRDKVGQDSSVDPFNELLQ